MAERDVQRAEEAREELNSVDKATVRVGCCLDLLAWASRSGGQAAGCRSPEGEEQGPPPKITIPAYAINNKLVELKGNERIRARVASIAGALRAAPERRRQSM